MRYDRFKRRQQRIKSPEINLVPMMDVLMVVLTFFIIISMVLTAEKGVNLALTGGKNQPLPAANDTLPEPMIVELGPPEQIIVNKRVITRNQLLPEVSTYLVSHAKGVVLLKADRQLQYQTVIDVLGSIQSVGGDRVSLALDASTPSPTAVTQTPPVPNP